jgi:hypothetical protein
MKNKLNLVQKYESDIMNGKYTDYMDIADSIAADNLDGLLSDEEYDRLVALMENYNYLKY